MTTTMTTADHHRYVVEFEALEKKLVADQPDSVRRLRREAIECFAELGFPTVRDEDWRFTNVAPIARLPFALEAAGDGINLGDLSPCRFEDAIQLTVLNGRLLPQFSDLRCLPEGVMVCGLRETLKRFPERVEPFLGQHASFAEHAFVALNTALFGDGVLVWVPKGVVVERPINLVIIGQPSGSAPIAVFPRNLFVSEESSQVTLVEQYASVGEGTYLTCPVTEIVVGDNAVVDHYKLQRESTSAFHAATLQVWQGRDSNFSSHSISWGGGLVRNDVNAVLDGEGCESTLNGLYMVEGEQLIDNHMRVDHVKPHCDSHELYKGILEGRSRAVFNGRIYVHPGAQKTDAKQTNRNLLLSPEALCNSNPQLEIFADDVKCTHGSTVGQLDDLGVFYLRSRGIGEEAARSLLTYAFAADIVERIRVSAVRAELEEFLFRRLPKGDIVRQAV